MSENWVADIGDMHLKFGVNTWQYENKNNKELMQKYIAFRMAMIQEEVDETNAAIKDGNAEEIVDGLIDMCVFAIGTLNVFGMDSQRAWDVKESRPNPFGMPDLIKPEGWEGPSHEGNHGDLPNII